MHKKSVGDICIYSWYEHHLLTRVCGGEPWQEGFDQARPDGTVAVWYFDDLLYVPTTPEKAKEYAEHWMRENPYVPTEEGP